MSTPRLILNLDELVDLLIPMIENLDEEIKRNPIELNAKVKNKLEEIKDKIPITPKLEDFNINIKHLLELLKHIQKSKGDFHIDSIYKNIPAIEDGYEIIFNYDYDIYLCSIEFSETGWKKNDEWSLIIGNKNIFNNIPTKEIGDKKYFYTLKYIPANTDIKFILHNNSGNSRQIWVDLGYIKEN